MKIKSNTCSPVFLGGACGAVLGGTGAVLPFLLSLISLFAFFMHSDTIPSNNERNEIDEKKKVRNNKEEMKNEKRKTNVMKPHCED